MKCEECVHYRPLESPLVLTEGKCDFDGLFVDRDDEHGCGIPDPERLTKCEP